jgi:predicted ATP-grasp superfamily ATP-dependent carboligase
VQSHPEHESAAIAERLLLDLGYQGIAAAEFKRDFSTGELKIIEINPRPSLWFSISTAAGVKVTATAVADLLGSNTSDRMVQEDGIRWRYLVKDALSALFYRRSKSFVLEAPNIEVVGPAQSKVSAVFSMGDPKPALAEILGFAAKGTARLAKRFRGRQ